MPMDMQWLGLPDVANKVWDAHERAASQYPWFSRLGRKTTTLHPDLPSSSNKEETAQRVTSSSEKFCI